MAQIYSEEKESSRKETLKKREVWKGYHNPEIKKLITMDEGDVSDFMETQACKKLTCSSLNVIKGMDKAADILFERTT